MNTAAEEFVTSYTSYFGPHPDLLVMLSLFIGGFIVLLSVAYYAHRGGTKQRKDIPVFIVSALLTASCAVVGLTLCGLFSMVKL